MIRQVSCFIILCLAALLLLQDCVSAENYTLIKDRSNVPILTPAIAKWNTEKIQLKNGLQIYLISDPDASMSGAMMSVNVGSWEDPEEHPGLAHFLEHMLFFGTRKYPKESEYDRFITGHGGQSNAFTTPTDTNYLFTVRNDAIEGALDRFSNFFKEPLFSPSGVSRELRAIDQEYAKNLEQDPIRQIHIFKALSNPKHPFHRFTMGNTQTLAKASRQTLKNWYQQHYSANLMRLVVYSSLSIEKMRDMVIEDFIEIPNRNRDPFTTDQQALLADLKDKYVYIEPIKNTRTLTILWELPHQFTAMQDTRPDKIVCHVLGHEGEKSLLAQLKREGLGESLLCGGSKFGNHMFLLYLQIELTNDGLRDVDQVITRCFQSIANFRDRDVPYYLFEELKLMETLAYQYQPEENEFMMLMKHAQQIHDEDFSTYPERTKIIQKFDPQSVSSLLNHLTPQNGSYFIMAPSTHSLVETNLQEQWMGVNFAIKQIPAEVMGKWTHASPHASIDIPDPNIFIPYDLELVVDDLPLSNGTMPVPKLLSDHLGSRIYFSPDNRYRVPKISWIFTIRTPQITLEDSLKVVFGDLYVKCLNDAMSKFTYPAKIAGLEYHITREQNGIKIELSGYSQNAHLLLANILDTMRHLDFSMAKFKINKDSLLRQYQNFSKESPLQQSFELFKSLLYKDYVTEKEKATAIRKGSFKKFKEYVSRLFETIFIEGLIYGNISEIQAQEVAAKIDSTFDGDIYLEKEHKQKFVMVLPQEEGPYYLEMRTKSQGNAAFLAIENSDFSFKERAAQQIMMQAIKRPFFEALRTQQQTGYLVHSFPEEIERNLFNIFIVQSNTHDPRDLLSRFEALVESYLQKIGNQELTEEQYHNIRQPLLKNLEESAKNVKDMGRLLYKLAFAYDGDFDWLTKRIEGFQELTYSEFLAMVRRFLGRENKQRLAILLSGEIPQENVFSYTRARTWNTIRKISEYTSASVNHKPPRSVTGDE